MIKSDSDLIRTRLEESAEVKRLSAEKCLDTILLAVKLLIKTFKSGKKVLICGNGGSAADCQHMAAELVSSFSKDISRAGLAAIALTTDTSIITAYSNDFNFEGVFKRQVQALGKKGDVLIGISTSGNSKNVIEAIKAARELNMGTVGLIGKGGRIKDLVDIAISVPSLNTQYVQETHLAIEHILCELVERNLFEGAKDGYQ